MFLFHNSPFMIIFIDSSYRCHYSFRNGSAMRIGCFKINFSRNEKIEVFVYRRTCFGKIVSFLLSICVCIFILSQESNQSAITSSLRSYLPSVYHTKLRDSRYVLFPTAQQVNLPACSPHCPYNAERRTG